MRLSAVIAAVISVSVYAACAATRDSTFGDAAADASSVSSGATMPGAGGSGQGGGFSFGGSGQGGSVACEQPCSTDFHHVIDCDGNILETCTGTEGCNPSTGTCENACKVAEDNKFSVGCGYLSTYMENLHGECFAAFVANTWNQPAHITVEYAGKQLAPGTFGYIPVGAGPGLSYQPFNAAAGIPPGEVVILFLSGQLGTPGPGQAFCPKSPATPNSQMMGTGIGNSFRIDSDVPVVAYQINPYGGGSAAVTGASLLLPTSVWSDNYVAVSAYHGNMPANPSFNIVAEQDNTVVTMLPSAQLAGAGGIPGGPANSPVSFTLQRGQNAQISQSIDLTGSVIQATKRVGFMAGHRCAFIPSGVLYCDHGEQMIPPVKALGSEYAGVMYRPRMGEPAVWRAIGVIDGTVLTWSKPVGGPASLNRGQIGEFFTGEPFLVSSQDADHPFVLFQHMSGSTWKPGMDGYGDSDSVISVPTKQYMNSYVFFADPTYPETNLVLVRAKGKDDKFHDVTLDCAGVIGGFAPVDAAGAFEWARADLIVGNFQNVGNCSTGRHEIKSDAPFGLWVWGWGTPLTSTFTKNVSYGYPGGMNVVPINNVVIVPDPN
ncbi:MAG: hypothetical protein EXR75_01225 [Myxococcales bacterium]|nr:hypothetical protein [Myxococcales bacterium]